MAKVFGHSLMIKYRESYGMHASSGILFNHESPRRGHEFVTRKVSEAIARISLGLQDELTMGPGRQARLGFCRRRRRSHVAHAGDCVVATGDTRTVVEFAEAALPRAELGDSWRDHIEVDVELLRPAEAPALVGDAGKARRELGWEPTVRFQELVARMVDHDMELVQRSRE